jgi:hypothetical protein
VASASQSRQRTRWQRCSVTVVAICGSSSVVHEVDHGRQFGRRNPGRPVLGLNAGDRPRRARPEFVAERFQRAGCGVDAGVLELAAAPGSHRAGLHALQEPVGRPIAGPLAGCRYGLPRAVEPGLGDRAVALALGREPTDVPELLSTGVVSAEVDAASPLLTRLLSDRKIPSGLGGGCV